MSPQRRFLSKIPTKSLTIFLIGVFAIFATVPLANDVARLGRTPRPRFAIEVLVSCIFAVGYAAAGFILRKTAWKVMVPLFVGETIIFTVLARWMPFYPLQADMDPRSTAGLASRLGMDALGIVVAIAVGYACFVYASITEGRRYFRLHAEIALAQEIHKVLAPAIDARAGGFEFYGRSLPSGEVGGDLIDLATAENNWVAYLADVSGHGVAPGLVMGMAKSASRMLLTSGENSELLMPRLNEVLYPLKKPDMFITFCFVASHGERLLVGLAGHPAILQFSPVTGVVTEIESQNMPLGILPTGEFVSSEISADKGAVFALYTDGFLETANAAGEEYGVRRFKEELRKQGREPLETIYRSICESVARHGAQFDDQSMLLIRKM